MATIAKLEAAIRLFFEGGDPVAVHTLAAAAQGVIRDIARARKLGHTSLLHDHPDIPSHDRKQWYKVLNEPRNFFKHAEDDPDGSLEFDEGTNELLLMDAVLILPSLDSTSLSEANVFVGWFTTAHPELRPAISNNVIGDFCIRNQISHRNLRRFRELCDERIQIEPVQPE